ncbi:NAD(P)H-hydrate dehydratase [Mucilaginibacter sp. E4BP6]|uniref:NAD(P)H-hydrate dehydratase n=1 Tax=Mucilaginibacter sp. E4BP6 TaxID=2723089 RepID=UPI0015CDAE29|nr:NAD(P)H-hydrate dehydratase [Mucilaginibacter sp. E4BP6]NYE68449.1 NAD(P)H-hydrate epimerase [Mucilaginibacter sp. E4BP6]
MLPLLTSPQIREADAYTIAHEPISSVNLMERASKAFVGWFVNHFPDKRQAISIYCGTGNNGGDGLAVARILHGHHYKAINIKITRFSDKTSDDFNANLKKLQSTIAVTEIKPGDDFPDEDSPVLIDAMLGSGLNKPLHGDYEKLVKHLNLLEKTVVAVDIPTGFFAEGEIKPESTVLKAKLVITFQQPKINFLLPESGPVMECWEAVNIGIDDKFVMSLDSPYQFITEKDIRQLMKHRHKFSNKGTFGHALIVAGQAKTMGAALLCSSACAHAGAGLTTACVPESGLTALNSYLPEIMAVVREGNDLPEISWDKFSTMGIGPGLGNDENSLNLICDILTNYKKPIVIDADALNILAEHKQLWSMIPEGSIITPHMKEFDRLFGESTSWWQRLQTAIEKAKEHKICIVLKNDYTITATPDGKAYFNSTSNASMASGGMGDVLTGIITALLAQKYSSRDACIIGTYIHGKAGDELALPNRMHVVLPGKLISQLPMTIAKFTA